MNENVSLQLWAAVLLLIGGLVHLIPSLYETLARVTGGTPWVQIIVGILSVIVALVLFAGEKSGAGDSGMERGDTPAPKDTLS